MALTIAKTEQVNEQLETVREKCRQLESQLAAKDVSLTAAQGKIELLTADSKTKVCPSVLHH